MSRLDDCSTDLAKALVCVKHRQQYLTDAEFKASIDQLARMLPLWIDGIAAVCAETRAEREATIDALKRSTSPMIVPLRAHD